FWPSNLATLHAPRIGNTWELLPSAYHSAAIVAIVTLLALALAYRYRHRWPAAIILLLAFIGMIVPVSGLGQSGPQIAAERYTYQPGWALTILVVLTAYRLLSYIAIRTRRITATVLIVVCSASLGFATVRRQADWHDTLALWKRQLVVYPDDPY